MAAATAAAALDAAFAAFWNELDSLNEFDRILYWEDLLDMARNIRLAIDDDDYASIQSLINQLFALQFRTFATLQMIDDDAFQNGIHPVLINIVTDGLDNSNVISADEADIIEDLYSELVDCMRQLAQIAPNFIRRRFINQNHHDAYFGIGGQTFHLTPIPAVEIPAQTLQFHTPIQAYECPVCLEDTTADCWICQHCQHQVCCDCMNNWVDSTISYHLDETFEYETGRQHSTCPFCNKSIQ
jgi:hypothetical protein